MADLIPIQTLLGQETWEEGTWQLFLFGVSYPQCDAVKSAGIGVHAKDDTIPQVQLVRKNAVAASKQGRKDELGRWTSATFGALEGSVFKIYARRSGAWGRKPIITSLLIRMRATAAMHRVQLALSNRDDATFTHAYVTGRFDILTPENAETYGVELNVRDRKFLESTWGSGLDVLEIEPGVREETVPSLKTRTNSDGEEVKVLSRRKRRAIE
jgi:hypothetical protein